MEDAAGEANELWTGGDLRHRRLTLGARYVAAVVLCATVILALAQVAVAGGARA